MTRLSLTALHCRSQAHLHGERAQEHARGTRLPDGVPFDVDAWQEEHPDERVTTWPGSAQYEAREAARYARVALYLEERATRKLRRRAA